MASVLEYLRIPRTIRFHRPTFGIPSVIGGWPLVVGSPRPGTTLHCVPGHVRALAGAGGRLPLYEPYGFLRSSGPEAFKRRATASGTYMSRDG